MQVARSWKPKGLLQHDLAGGAAEQVGAAYHVGDALLGVVDDHGQLVGVSARRDAAARSRPPCAPRCSAAIPGLGPRTRRRGSGARRRSAGCARTPSRSGPGTRAGGTARRPSRVAGFPGQRRELAARVAEAVRSAPVPGAESGEGGFIGVGAGALSQHGPVPVRGRSARACAGCLGRHRRRSRGGSRSSMRTSQVPPVRAGVEVAADGRDQGTEMQRPGGRGRETPR